MGDNLAEPGAFIHRVHCLLLLNARGKDENQRT